MVRSSFTFAAIAVALLATSSVAAPIEVPGVYERAPVAAARLRQGSIAAIRAHLGMARSITGDEDELFERAVPLPIRRGPVFTTQVIRSVIDGDDLEERGFADAFKKVKQAATQIKNRQNKHSLIDGDDLEERGIGDVFNKVKDTASNVFNKVKNAVAKGPLIRKKLAGKRSLIDGDDLEERGIGDVFNKVKKAVNIAKGPLRIGQRSLIDGDDLEERGIGDVFNKVKNAVAKGPLIRAKLASKRSLIDGDELEERGIGDVFNKVKKAVNIAKGPLRIGQRSLIDGDEDLVDRELEFEWE